MNMNDLVGKRMLLKLNSNRMYGGGPVDEYKVLEVSPAGNWVKLQNINGKRFWSAVTDVAVVEELKDLKADKPKDI